MNRKRRNETREERDAHIAKAMARIFDKHDATFRALAEDDTTKENATDAANVDGANTKGYSDEGR